MDFTAEFLDQANGNSLYRLVGIRLEEVGDGKAKARLQPNPELCWPFPKQPHGGVLFTLVDTTMAWAVIADVYPDHTCTTISTNIQYTAPANGGFCICSAQVTHQTGRLSFVQARVTGPDSKLLAMAQGTFRIVRSEKIV
jgi:uncharacterized protein (TIGR00369 family)